MILLIDNYDSFTWNLYQYFCELGADVLVKRNDALTLADIDALKPQKIVISPGPCTPDEAGISLDVIRHYAGRLPILGVCLGHQAMAQAFGGKVVRAAKVMHGKTSPITHNGVGVFKGLANPLTVTRYHSLVVEPDSLPECFEVTAWVIGVFYTGATRAIFRTNPPGILINITIEDNMVNFAAFLATP
ncbi:glutamine amidotransferase-related protein, partial [Escherichia coli]